MLRKKDKEKILFFRESTFNIAKLIFDSPNKSYHIRLLEKETGYSTTAVTRSVKDLEKFDIVVVEKTSLTKNIKANLDSEAYRFYKTVFNLYRLNRYLLVDNLIKQFNRPEAIVLFGSFARGEDIEKSDIDILIISQQKQSLELKAYEDDLHRTINLHILPDLTKSSQEFKNAVANGMVLYGYLKVI